MAAFIHDCNNLSLGGINYNEHTDGYSITYDSSPDQDKATRVLFCAWGDAHSLANKFRGGWTGSTFVAPQTHPVHGDIKVTDVQIIPLPDIIGGVGIFDIGEVRLAYGVNLFDEQDLLRERLEITAFYDTYEASELIHGTQDTEATPAERETKVVKRDVTILVHMQRYEITIYNQASLPKDKISSYINKVNDATFKDWGVGRVLFEGCSEDSRKTTGGWTHDVTYSFLVGEHDMRKRKNKDGDLDFIHFRGGTQKLYDDANFANLLPAGL